MARRVTSWAGFDGAGRIYEVRIWHADARAMTPPGRDAEPAVRRCLAMPRYSRQLDAIPWDAIADYLAKFGCWDDAELADEDMNRVRLLWSLAGDVIDELGGHFR